MFPLIRNIRMESLPRIAPAIGGLQSVSDRGIKHVVVFGEESVGPCALLGKVNETTTGGDLSNANLWLDVSRPRVGIVFGRRGSGKSYDLGVIIEALAASNTSFKIGTYCPPVVVFDPLNQFWTLEDKPDEGDPEERQQLQELDRWGIEPVSLSNVRLLVPRGSPRRHPSAIEFGIRVSSMNVDDWCGFFQVNKYTDPMGQLVSAAYDKVTNSGYVSAEQGNVPPCTDYDIGHLTRCITEDAEINDPNRGFHANTIRGIVARLAELSRTPLFASSADLVIQDIFAPGVLSVFMLRDVDEATRGVVVSQAVKKIVQARSFGRDAEELARRLRVRAQYEASEGRKDELERYAASLVEGAAAESVPSGWIVMDEAHTLCPASGATASREVLIELAKQGRQLGLSILAATQQPSALSTKLCSQRDYIILHSLGIRQDVDAGLALVNPNFPSSIGVGKDLTTTNIPSILLNSLRRGEAIFSTDEVNRNFLIKIRPRATAHGGKEPLFT